MPGEGTQCFFGHVALELFAIMNTSGVSKNITNITVPKQEKQISPRPPPLTALVLFSEGHQAAGVCHSLPADLSVEQSAGPYHCVHGAKRWTLSKEWELRLCPTPSARPSGEHGWDERTVTHQRWPRSGLTPSPLCSTASVSL